MIQPVNSPANQSVYKSGNKPAAKNQGVNTPQTQEEPAATVTLSEEAKNKYAADGKISLDASDFYKSCLKFDPSERVLKCFGKDDIETSVDLALRGRIDNYNEVAEGLGKLLSSYKRGNGETLEERAANRATGLKLAEQLAKTYLSGDEAEAFMKKAQQAVESDEWREKGYYVSDNESESKVRKEAKLPAHLAEKAVPSSIQKYNEDGSLTTKYMEARMNAILENNRINGAKIEEWREKEGKAFEENATKIGETIKKAKSTLNAEQINNNLQQLIKNFGLPQMFAK